MSAPPAADGLTMAPSVARPRFESLLALCASCDAGLPTSCTCPDTRDLQRAVLYLLDERSREGYIALRLDHAKQLLRFLRLRSGPGDIDPVNAQWGYLYALQDAIAEAEKAT